MKILSYTLVITVLSCTGASYTAQECQWEPDSLALVSHLQVNAQGNMLLVQENAETLSFHVLKSLDPDAAVTSICDFEFPRGTRVNEVDLSSDGRWILIAVGGPDFVTKVYYADVQEGTGSAELQELTLGNGHISSADFLGEDGLMLAVPSQMVDEFQSKGCYIFNPATGDATNILETHVVLSVFDTHSAGALVKSWIEREEAIHTCISRIDLEDGEILTDSLCTNGFKN